MKLRERIDLTKDLNKLVQAELKWVLCECERMLREAHLFENVKQFDVVAAVRGRVVVLSELDALAKRGNRIKAEFKEIFEPIPHVDDLPDKVVARIHLKDASKTFATRSYKCPQKYRDLWATLLQKHLDSGRIRPSSSSFASPAFIFLKADPAALPWWVNDYRQLNANTVVDSHPLPRVDDILADCAKGKIWSTIDMMDSFFQRRVCIRMTRI